MSKEKTARPTSISPSDSDGEGVYSNQGDAAYGVQAAVDPALLAKRDWTPEEESAARGKVDRIVMPLLILAFFALQLDRGNISGALTDGFLVDVGITQNQFNIGQQLLSLGIVILEVPANLILYRLGPQIWLSAQIVAWGLVSLFQAFQHGLAAFLITRLLLGLTEGGFIPAGLWVISQWYTREETSKRFAIYFLGNLIAAATTGLLSYGILHMRGVAGQTGWWWLFVLSGIFTVLVGFIFALFFPGSVDKPTPWLLPKIKYFTERELYILKWRVIIDQPTKQHKQKSISFAQLKSALSNWRIYPHVLITLASAAPANAVGSYAPTIVASFGYDRLRANALASVGGFILVILLPIFGIVSDITNKRGLIVVAALVLSWGGFLMNVLVQPTSTSRSLRYGSIVWVQSVLVLFHPLNGAWLSLSARNPEERAIALALFIMGANSSGIIGAQLFRQDDRPRYNRGFKVSLALVSFGLFVAIAQNIQYWWTTKRAVARARADPTYEPQILGDRRPSVAASAAAAPPSGRRPSVVSVFDEEKDFRRLSLAEQRGRRASALSDTKGAFVL